VKFVIICSSKKTPNYWTFEGRQVRFVARPDRCPSLDSVLYCRPDDTIPSGSRTWRQDILAYNEHGTNPARLPRAADLYTHPIYSDLVRQYGWHDVFILSAGWGLIRADFLLPSYDITFSSQAGGCNRRRKSDSYDDFNHLWEYGGLDPGETVYYCGSNDYLPLYYRLTRDLPARKVIYHKAQNPPRKEGYVYIQYITSQSTNWHYTCAREFIQGKLQS
jgi:hypothetical protein